MKNQSGTSPTLRRLLRAAMPSTSLTGVCKTYYEGA